MNRFALAIVAAVLLIACGGEKDDPAARDQAEVDVLDLAIRTELLRLYEADTTWGSRPVFLALGSLGPSGFKDPPDALIKSLGDMPVRIASIANRNATGSTSADGGVLFAVEIRKWVSPTTVEINLSKNESERISGYSIRLVKSGGKWIFVHSFNFYSS